jgi:hypothetical protein
MKLGHRLRSWIVTSGGSTIAFAKPLHLPSNKNSLERPWPISFPGLVGFALAKLFLFLGAILLWLNPPMAPQLIFRPDARQSFFGYNPKPTIAYHTLSGYSFGSWFHRLRRWLCFSTDRAHDSRLLSLWAL